VDSVEFVTPQHALESFRGELAERGGFLDGLEKGNPLPASFDIGLSSAVSKKALIEEFVEQLRSSAEVDDVIYGSEWLERLQGVLKVLRFFGLLVGALMLAIVVFLISNTIKLIIYSRRDEIEIMQLVGATDATIKLPFLVGGALQGLLGSVVGLGLLGLGYGIVDYSLRGSALFGVVLPNLSFLGVGALSLIVLGGVVIGGVASLFALGRHMNV
jgi:cell division transport system permease protein